MGEGGLAMSIEPNEIEENELDEEFEEIEMEELEDDGIKGAPFGKRLIAGGIDVGVSILLSYLAGLIVRAIPFVRVISDYVAVLVLIIYVSIRDSLPQIGSIGKKTMGLKVLKMENLSELTVRDSILRNLPFSVILLLSLILGLIGMVLSFIPFISTLINSAFSMLVLILSLLIMGVEIFFIYSGKYGRRLGDRLAGTVVISEE